MEEDETPEVPSDNSRSACLCRGTLSMITDNLEAMERSLHLTLRVIKN